MNAAYAILALVAFLRIVELAIAARNTRALLRRGAIEIGKEHYPLIVLFHAIWLIVIAVLLPHPTIIHAIPLVFCILLQAARAWVIVSLGPYWTTRIITLKDAPLITRGPYRFMRHPNYFVVVLEVFAFPLIFGQIGVAIIGTVINAGLLLWRIKTEETALGERRELHQGIIGDG